MNYFASTTKYILVKVEMSPTKTDGSRDILNIEEIAKSHNKGALEYLRYYLYGTATNEKVMYKVITVSEAKKFKKVHNLYIESCKSM